MPRSNPFGPVSQDALNELDDLDFIRLLWMRKLKTEELIQKQHPNSQQPIRARNLSKLSQSSFTVSEGRKMSMGKSMKPLYSTESPNPLQSAELFKILPCKGQLIPGDSQEITIRFTYTQVGCHKWFVLLRIYPDIFIWIDLLARTISNDQPAIQFMNDKKFNLHPISISNMDPPTQVSTLNNNISIKAVVFSRFF